MLDLIDLDFIYDLEGGIVLEAYVPTNKHGVPLGNSGVTVGAGVDLGQISLKDLDFCLLQFYLAKSVRTSLPHSVCQHKARFLSALCADFCDKRGNEALSSLAEFKSLHGLNFALSDSQARELTESRYLSILSVVFSPPKPYMSQRLRTIVASVAIQYGPRLSIRTPRFYKFAFAGDIPAVIDELRNFGDDYPTRRNKEADYLEVSDG